MSDIRITSIGTQQYVLQTGSMRNRLQIASTTQDVELQKELLESKSIRLLIALASNPDLDPEIEQALVEKKNTQITNTLLNRTV